MSPILSDLYVHDTLRQCKQKLKHYAHCLYNKRYLMTALFPDDQVIVAGSGDSPKREAHELNLTAKKYNLKIST